MSNQTHPTHTPGPWQFIGEFIGTVEDDPQTIAYTEGDAGKIVGHVSEHRNRQRRPKAEQEANARLIAAAPDLLEALEEVDKILYHYLSEVHPLRVKIETALAKAKG